MPVSFYLIAAAVFLIIAFFLYRATMIYFKKELSLKNLRFTLAGGALRGVLPISLVITVLIMLAVQHYFY